MLILDGCFLIELFLRGLEDDPICNVSYMHEYLYHDLLLLENQLPWSVLEFFYDLIELGNSKKALSEVVIDFFKSFEAAGARIFSYPKRYGEIFHILDLIRTALILEEHQYEFLRTTISHLQQQRIPTAVTLLKAGVKLEKGPAGCILDVKFKAGVLTIPVLTIDERTCPLFTNLLAYEQCFRGRSYKFTSYVVLMRNLIRTSKDVDLLCEEGIVVNWLLSSEDASKVFDEVCIDSTINEYHYQILCSEVDKYHKSLWGKWMRVINFICTYKLKHDYFDTPWATISVLAAFVFLVLTILQAIYAILPYYHHPAPPPG